MKLAVYLSMLLLLGPLLRFAGVVISALFLMVMFGLGIYLVVGGSDRRGYGPQQPHLQPPSAPGQPQPWAPQLVVVVPPDQWPWAAPGSADPAVAPASEDVRAVHPGRRPREDRPPLWVRPGP